MDLYINNVVREENLVVLKKDVRVLVVGVNLTKFESNIYYRSIMFESGEAIINGELIVNYDKNFETVQQRMLRDFETLGIIVNGKVISRTAFSKILDIHKYGRGKDRLSIGYVMRNPKEMMYGFFPSFKGESKFNTIKIAYSYVLDIIEGYMNCVDTNLVQFGNCGIPLSASSSTRLRVRESW